MINNTVTEERPVPTLNKLERLDKIIKNSLSNGELPIEEQAMLAKLALLVEVQSDILSKLTKVETKVAEAYQTLNGAPALITRFVGELAETNQNVANLAETVEALRGRESTAPRRGARKASTEPEKVETPTTSPNASDPAAGSTS